MYPEDEFLALSGIQHFAFCRRQWALIHVDQAWSENVLTVQGSLMHARAHDDSLHERREDVLTVRGLTVCSADLGVWGKCDVVEFHQDAAGFPLQGEKGLWRVVPVEYKRGRSKPSDEDRLQLCAQAMCLEDMFVCDVSEGFLYYGSTHSRERVEFSADLRGSVRDMFKEMHSLYGRGWVPKARASKHCRACSLVDICVPKLAGTSVASYVDGILGGEA